MTSPTVTSDNTGPSPAVTTPASGLTTMPAAPSTRAEKLRWGVSDLATVAGRSYAQLRAHPAELAGYLIFPVIMIVLFAYVFGSAITLPDGGDYREFLMPGIFMQTMALVAVQAAVAVADDMQAGIIDRFRSLPIARSAVLAGRNLADLSLRVVGLAIMVALAVLLAGWRIHRGLLDAAAGFGIVILFALAMLWAGTFIGLSVGTATLADQATFAWLFPMTFLANTFVPTQGLPGWLQPSADWNPMSATVQAMRHLFGNPSAVSGTPAWPLQHAAAVSIGWSLLLLVVFVTLSVRRYRTASTR
jgi:ABC-2 type transport system permease protein